MADAAQASGGNAQRHHLSPRRHGIRPPGQLRRADRYAQHRPPGRERAQVQQLPHDGSLLAFPGRDHGGAKPPPDRPRLPLADGDGIPRIQRLSARVRQVGRQAPAEGRVRQLRDRQVGPHAPLRGLGERAVRPLAERRGLRSLLRLHGRRRRQLPLAGVARPLPDRGLDGEAGLPLERGDGGRGDPQHHVARLRVARQAVHDVLGAGRHALAAPGAARVHRALQGQVRHGLGSGPRDDPPAAARDGHHSRGHPDSPSDRRRSRPGTAWSPRSSASTRGRWRCSRRCSPTWTSRSAASSGRSSGRDSSTTRSSSSPPTTAPRAKAA